MGSKLQPVSLVQPLITGGRLCNVTADCCPSGLPLDGHLGTQHSDHPWLGGLLLSAMQPWLLDSFSASIAPGFPLARPHWAAHFVPKHLPDPSTCRLAPLGREKVAEVREIWGGTRAPRGQRILLQDIMVCWYVCIFPWMAGCLGNLVGLGATDKCPSQRGGSWIVKRPFHGESQYNLKNPFQKSLACKY